MKSCLWYFFKSINFSLMELLIKWSLQIRQQDEIWTKYTYPSVQWNSKQNTSFWEELLKSHTRKPRALFANNGFQMKYDFYIKLMVISPMEMIVIYLNLFFIKRSPVLPSYWQHCFSGKECLSRSYCSEDYFGQTFLRGWVTEKLSPRRNLSDLEE